jgi:hypothetical protein
VHAAAERRLRLVRVDAEELTSHDELTRIAVPVIERIGNSEIRGSAIFEVRDGEIVAFEVSSERLCR